MGHVKIVQSGKLLEIYEYEKSINPKLKNTRPKRQGITKIGRISKARRPDNVRRLRKRFLRLVTSNLGGQKPPLFITLTMASVVPLSVAYKRFTHFCVRLRRVAGTDWRAITVPEFQKRGAVHFHMLLWQGAYSLENERNTRLIQNIWQRGTVDCMQTDGSPKLAYYFAKYMLKTLHDKRYLGEKAFVSTRNVLQPLSLSFGTAIDYASDIWGIDLSTDEPLHEAVFDTKWLGKGRYRKFNLE